MATKKKTTKTETTKKKKTTETTKNEPMFTKEQIIHSKRYQELRDVCIAVIPDGFKGTLTQADNLIDEFMKGKVK